MFVTKQTKAWCESNDDMSQQTWFASPKWQKDSAIDGVKFHLNNPDAGDSASHENWMKLKKSQGWVYGEIKDPDNKTHPCILPFDALPEHQKKKDALFRAIVHALG